MIEVDALRAYMTDSTERKARELLHQMEPRDLLYFTMTLEELGVLAMKVRDEKLAKEEQ